MQPEFMRRGRVRPAPAQRLRKMGGVVLPHRSPNISSIGYRSKASQPGNTPHPTPPFTGSTTTGVLPRQSPDAGQKTRLPFLRPIAQVRQQ
jgi:hypothetical protein